MVNVSTLLQEQHGRCYWCDKILTLGSSDLTKDLLIPEALGGTTCYDNLVASCRQCHVRFANRRIKSKIAWLRNMLAIQKNPSH